MDYIIKKAKYKSSNNTIVTSVIFSSSFELSKEDMLEELEYYIENNVKDSYKYTKVTDFLEDTVLIEFYTELGKHSYTYSIEKNNFIEREV